MKIKDAINNGKIPKIRIDDIPQNISIKEIKSNMKKIVSTYKEKSRKKDRL